MRGTHRVAQILAATLAVALIMLFAGCGGSTTSHTTGGGSQPISVSITQGATASVTDGATLTLNATVVNDSANAGVTWSVTGAGTLSGATTTSVIYNPPASGSGSDTVTATSKTDATKSASITISYSPPAISVTITQGATASVADGLTMTLNATVANDSSNAGVTWTVTGAGTLSSAAATSVVYTAPASGTGSDTVTATSKTDTSKSASITISYSPPAIAVTITQGATASVVDGLTLDLNATVANDSSNAGVTWSVTGTGTLSNKTTTSARYNAPASGTGTDTVTATSITDTSKSASIQITYGPPPSISVTITGKFSQIQAGTAQVTLTATVQNDALNAGVTWTLTSGGTACSPSCGTLSSATATTVVYTPPATVPGTPTATITATSVTDPTKSDSDAFTITNTPVNACGSAPTGNESLLNGQYAFLMRGFEGSGTGTPVIYAASFTADGTGKVTGGELDLSNATTHQHITVDTTKSSYTVGLDTTAAGDLGCVTLASSGGTPTTFHFALGGVSGGVASKGRVIEFDDSTGTGTRAAGPLLLQDTTSFSLSKLQPRYAFGVDGWTMSGSQLEHFAMGGSFNISTSGAISSGYADVDNGGTVTSGVTGSSGSIGTISASTGRATGTQVIAGHIYNVAIYMISANEFLMVGTSPITTGPVMAGRAIVTGSSFSGASLSGNYIVSVNGASGGAANVTLGLLQLSGGAASGTLNSFDVVDGLQSQTISGGTYSVDATSGRVTLSNVGSNAPVIYLTSPTTDGVAAFIIGTDNSAAFGTAEPQPSATYSVSSISGSSFYGTQDMGDNTVQSQIGVVSVDSSGNATGTEQSSGQSGLNPSGSITGAVAINSDGTGTIGTGSFFVTNGTDYYFINGSDAEIFVGGK